MRSRIAAIALTGIASLGGIALTVAPAKAAIEQPAKPNDPIVCQTSWADDPHTAVAQCWGIGTWQLQVRCSNNLDHTGQPISQTTYASTRWSCLSGATVTEAYADILE
jgi:hypothetical protein